MRTGLDLIDAVGGLDVKSAELQARVGIATGLVVVGGLIGAGSAQEQSVVGEMLNLAARLQALAEPDAVVMPQARAGWSAISLLMKDDRWERIRSARIASSRVVGRRLAARPVLHRSKVAQHRSERSDNYLPHLADRQV